METKRSVICLVCVIALGIPQISAKQIAAAQPDTGEFVGLIGTYEDRHVDTLIPVDPTNSSDKERYKVWVAVQANQPWQTAYDILVDAQQGDLLRIRAQVEMTNDTGVNVSGRICLAVNGVQVGVGAGQGNTSEAHHMPLWADAQYVVPADGPVKVEALYAADRWDASPRVGIEWRDGGYGHLIIEHYRRFPSVSAAATAGARGLAQWRVDQTPDALTFGGSYARRSLAYNLTLSVEAGDIVRLLGQATSQYRPHGRVPDLEMHGQGILRDDQMYPPLSPWATENTYWAIQFVPLWTDAVDRPVATGTPTYSVSMHGDWYADQANPIVSDGGHLYAMLFRRIRPPYTGVLGLKRIVSTYGDESVKFVTANSGWKTLLDSEHHFQSGDVVRTIGFVQMLYPYDYAARYGIWCSFKSDLIAADGRVINTSSRASKYITADLEALPLRTEQLVVIPTTGGYRIRLSAECSREGASPRVRLEGSALMMLEQYGSP